MMWCPEESRVRIGIGIETEEMDLLENGDGGDIWASSLLYNRGKHYINIKHRKSARTIMAR
jgi:hypothetical protein